MTAMLRVECFFEASNKFLSNGRVWCIQHVMQLAPVFTLLTMPVHFYNFDKTSLQVWKPDTYFLNGKKSYLHKITVPNKFLRIKQNGELTYSMR